MQFKWFLKHLKQSTKCKVVYLFKHTDFVNHMCLTVSLKQSQVVTKLKTAEFGPSCVIAFFH